MDTFHIINNTGTNKEVNFRLNRDLLEFYYGCILVFHKVKNCYMGHPKDVPIQSLSKEFKTVEVPHNNCLLITRSDNCLKPEDIKTETDLGRALSFPTPGDVVTGRRKYSYYIILLLEDQKIDLLYCIAEHLCHEKFIDFAEKASAALENRIKGDYCVMVSCRELNEEEKNYIIPEDLMDLIS